MAHITIIGGTGYAGAHIAQTAADRGHDVTVIARSTPEGPIAGVTYREADVTDTSAIERIVSSDADVVISSLSPRGALAGEGKLAAINATIADAALAAKVRLGVIGGAGSLQQFEGGPLVSDSPDFPAEIKPEAEEMGRVLTDLRGRGDDLAWFYVSPAGGFGPWQPGEATGTYRLGGDVLLADEAGNSAISGADFALAVVKEIESPAHTGARFTVAY